MKYTIALGVTIIFIILAFLSHIEMSWISWVLMLGSILIAIFAPYFFVERKIAQGNHSKIISVAFGLCLGSLASVALNLSIMWLALIVRLSEIGAGSFGYHDTVFGELIGLGIFLVGLLLIIVGSMIALIKRFKSTLS